MQITVNVDADQLNETFVELFKNLSEDKKEEMALKIFEQWLRDPIPIEVSSHNAVLLSEYMNGNKTPYSNSDRVVIREAMEKIRNTISYNNDYRNEVAKFQSIRDVMFDECRKTTIEYFKKDLTEMITKDEGIQKLKEEIFDFIKSQFPSIIQNALALTFASNLNTLQNDISNNIMKTMQLNGSLEYMKTVLANKNLL